MWDLIVSVPDHCLSFYLSCKPGVEDNENKILYKFSISQTLRDFSLSWSVDKGILMYNHNLNQEPDGMGYQVVGQPRHS